MSNYPDNVTENMINDNFGACCCANCYHYCYDHTCALKTIEEESDYTIDDLEAMTAEEYEEEYKRACGVGRNDCCSSFLRRGRWYA